MFDFAVSKDALKDAQELVDEVIKGWLADMDDLCTLVRSYIEPHWVTALPEILLDKHKLLLDRMLAEAGLGGKIEKAFKGAALLGRWRKWFRELQTSRSGTCVSLEQSSVWSDAIRDASDYAQMVLILKQVCQVLPNIRNRNRRMAAANCFVETYKDFDLGASIDARVQDLVSGRFGLG